MTGQLFDPDSFVWFGVCLGLVGRMLLRTFSRAVNVLLVDWAERHVERRAHKRAIRELRQEAGGRRR